MRRRRLALLALAVIAVPGAAGTAAGGVPLPFPADWPVGAFHLASRHPAPAFSLAPAARAALALPAASPAWAAAGDREKKRPGRAILILSGFIMVETLRYWIESTKWREDWNYRLTWKDQRRRFLTLEANRFDSNPFVTNWTHLISGHLYFSQGRYYGLNPLESLLLSVGCSLWWEYVTEWREVISVNDNIFSAVGAISLAEPLFQLAKHYARRPGLLNQALAFVLDPLVPINDLLTAKARRPRWRADDGRRPDWQLSVGSEGWRGGRDAPDSPLLHVGIKASSNTISGHGDPRESHVGRWQGRTLASDISLDLAFHGGKVQEYELITRAVPCGYFRQRLDASSPSGPRGYNWFLGLATSFDLLKKRATAYYDKGEYHYDFAADEKPALPTAFTDKYAAIHLLGPILAANAFSRAVSARLELAASVDFALVNSLALNAYSLRHDIFAPRMKTTLIHYGYYYALGATASAAAGVRLGRFRLDGRCKCQWYGSIEGLDRFQSGVEDDAHLRDSRLSWGLQIGYDLQGTPLTIGFALENVLRRGTLRGTACRETQQRACARVTVSL